MGNQNCTQIHQSFHYNHAYGQFQIQKQNIKALALIQKKIQKCPSLKKQVQNKLKDRLKLKTSHIVKLHKYQIIQSQFDITVKMQYQYVHKTLSERIKQLQKIEQIFTERELFNIIYGVQTALLEFNQHQIKHGCLNTETILCQGNFYKITDVSSTTYVTSYHLVKRGSRNQFLSQKLLMNLSYKTLTPFYQLSDDLFSLGMIILMLTLKVQSIFFYDWNEKKLSAVLKKKSIETAIKNLQRNYSSKLVKKVKQLIQYEVQLSQKSQETTFTFTQLNEQIAELQHDMSRILSKVNRSHKESRFSNLNNQL